MQAVAAPRGWLRGPTFDLSFVVGVLALAVAAGALAMGSATLFRWVVLADVWLLAYPHVGSTFARLTWERPSRERHAFLLWGLPPLVLLGTAGVAWAGGLVALGTLYFVWQTVHYTMQSRGIARAYLRSAGEGDDRAAEAVVFLFPLLGVLQRGREAHDTFYGGPIWLPRTPDVVVFAVGVLAVVALVAWVRGARRRGLRGHTLFVASHVAITVVGYLVVRDITEGWLFLNVWHNAQYLMFVWAFRERQGGALSGRKNLAAYAAAVAIPAIAGYALLGWATSQVAWSILPVTLVVHLAVNFHHYLVDSVIWRRPRPAPAAREATSDA